MELGLGLRADLEGEEERSAGQSILLVLSVLIEGVAVWEDWVVDTDRKCQSLVYRRKKVKLICRYCRLSH